MVSCPYVPFRGESREPPDGDDVSGSFTITAIRTGRESATSGTTAGTIGQALNGTYGALTVAADGSYSYAATRSGADGLAAGATACSFGKAFLFSLGAGGQKGVERLLENGYFWSNCSTAKWRYH